MKEVVIEYYDWVDKEWKPCPESVPVLPEYADRELSALRKTYRKYKLRKTEM